MQISPETNLRARVYAASPVSPTMAVDYQFCLYSILKLKKQLRYRCAARCHKVVPLRQLIFITIGICKDFGSYMLFITELPSAPSQFTWQYRHDPGSSRVSTLCPGVFKNGKQSYYSKKQAVLAGMPEHLGPAPRSHRVTAWCPSVTGTFINCSKS